MKDDIANKVIEHLKIDPDYDEDHTVDKQIKARNDNCLLFLKQIYMRL